uniref:Amino acid transporter transmembrane domain-containing protein n=1 Tax=Spongospora subterranea TaxID=70186 RepID=A0A0H5QQI6_9EUKA|eukprot:CRZ03736.1 hypothetical protein [Spongospora subterranea]
MKELQISSSGDQRLASIKSISPKALEEARKSGVKSKPDNYNRSEDVKSVARASFNFANTILGAGIIGMPFALKRTGLLMGCLLMMFVAYLSAYSSRMLVQCANKVGATTYEGLCRQILGGKAFNVVLLCMGAFAFGGMTAYLILIGDAATFVSRAWFGTDTIFSDRRILILGFSCICVLPLSLIRDITKLSFGSFLGLVSIAVIVITVIWHGPAAAQQMTLAENQTSSAISVIESTLFAGIGTMSFAFVCNHSAFIVFNSLDHPTPSRWRLITNISVGFAFFMCFIFGVSGYVNFRQSTKADILGNFPASDEVMNISRVMLVTTMIFTYPMEMFVARHCILQVVTQEEHCSYWKYALASVSLFAATLAIAITVPDVGIVIEVTGAISASCVGYILPGFIYLKMTGYEEVKRNALAVWNRAPNDVGDKPPFMNQVRMATRDVGPLMLVGFGILAMVAGTVTAFI